MELNNPSRFSAAFLKEFLKDGFGSLSKRDVEVLVFNLLLKDEIYDLPCDLFKACRDLKLTEAKVRNLYQASQLKYMQYDENEAKKRFFDIVERGLIERKGNKLIFIVREPLLRQYFEEWVAAKGGFTDSSFNKNLVIVNISIFESILDHLSDFDLNQIRPKFKDELATLEQAQDRPSLIRLFVEEFAKAAGKEAGSMSINGIVAGLKLLFFGQVCPSNTCQ